MLKKIKKSEDEWKQALEPDSYAVTRKGKTERAFSGHFNEHKADGVYHCICCSQPLFSSKHKFDSGTGWPSYFRPVAKEALEERIDKKLFMTRTEVTCSLCDAHLGHVFPDGPPPTGLRYCINSVALGFTPDFP